MTRTPNPPDGLSPDESRYVDGEMSEAETRSMEHRLAADPAAAARVEAWRNAMGLWRDDTQRAAAPVAAEPDVLADRVLASLARDERRGVVSLYVARRYAAAAVLLMAVGVTGTILARPTANTTVTPHVAGMEEIFLDVMAEGSEFAPGLTIPKEGR